MTKVESPLGRIILTSDGKKTNRSMAVTWTGKRSYYN